ncbi:uncharacterized protein IWZ02DRAFT_476266 [Phyllosticta citriasiana]|uniref:uncharacterized protein n=1 Tax=Phyllosticta citriasiana TaxID=595635 RepID=UPI0030FDD7EB
MPLANPFKAHEEHSRRAVNTPRNACRRTIWGQNDAHPSPFALNSVIDRPLHPPNRILVAPYSGNAVYVAAAANVGSHFVTSNLLLFGFSTCGVRSHFWLALLLLVITSSTCRRPTSATAPRRASSTSVVAAPLAGTLSPLYWVGAVAVHAHNLPARIVANIFVWGILVYGLFFLVAYKDYTIGFELSILAAALGVAQFFTKVIAFQWIFAFVIMALLFVTSVAVAVPGVLGRDPFKRGEIVSEDRERAPCWPTTREKLGCHCSFHEWGHQWRVMV